MKSMLVSRWIAGCEVAGLTCLAVALVLGAPPTASEAAAVGPTPYLQFSDSPWFGLGFSTFHLETFEDGVLDTPGVASVGADLVTLAGGIFTDSVDGDDGAVDGSGVNGRSHYALIGFTGIEYQFNAGVLGGLPTHAGVVWTDLSGTAEVFLEAFDSASISLGILAAGLLNDGLSTGQTAEDRFLGWTDSGGISKIRVYQSGSDMELDHLQYGIVPEPTGITMIMIMAGCALLSRSRT